MSWKERAQAMAEARAEVHDTYKVPVLVSSDAGNTWSPAFCRLHESANPDGNSAGTKPTRITVDTDSPVAIFRHSETPDLKNSSIISVSDGVSYIVKTAPVTDIYGYRTVRINRNMTNTVYPVPDWEAF